MFTKSPIAPDGCGAFLLPAALAAVTVLLPAESAYASPFLTRDQNPFTLVYGQPLPTPARLPAASEFRYALSLDISNTLNVETPTGESLYVDFEAYNLTLGGYYGLSDRWALKLDMPYIYRSGGVFDHAIDEWHKFFGLPRANRPDVEDDQFRLSYSINGLTALDLNTAQSGLADFQLGVGYGLVQNPDYAISLWAAADLPVGDSESVTGNDDLDYSFWLAGSTRTGEFSELDTNLGIVLPGDSVLAGLETEDLVVFGHAGAHLGLNRRLALKVQLAGHSGYYRDTSVDFLGSAWVIVFGGAINFGKCSTLDIGFSEDIQPGASPDAALLVSWKSQTGC